MNEWPAEGGSYVRNPDGSLTKSVEPEEQTVETPEAVREADEAKAETDNSTGKVK